MSTQITKSNLLVELSTEEQELLSGGKNKRCYKKCYWYCPKGERDSERDEDS
ncbi:MAG: hypothetical protein NWQ43_02515 [Dolichospermum sp.]|uniref:hypothetical protein n=1 Tax=Anabaena sp. UHCC 0187 TaxID=2590018 RepID=UPI00144738CA|nr:hypothetical protein [Anabaena sp. UHCC 0187]MDP5016178.1 hypothetical protein [Dolichospermum sp.]